MNLADLSIRRPIFITSIVLVMLAVGFSAMKRLGVDLFPDVTFPVVIVNTVYPGAGPQEIETLVSKPMEAEISTLPGIKRLSSISKEGISTVVAEFTLETDIKFAEQLIRDRANSAKRKLPTDVKDPVIRRIDPSDQPIVILSLQADLKDSELYDLANEVVKPRLEQVSQVGLVEILGGRRREIQVKLDREKLKAREVSVTQVAARLGASGENIPAGKLTEGSKEKVFRSLGQFNSLNDISDTLVNFYGNDVATSIKNLGEVKDTLQDENSRVFLNGEPGITLWVFKQSGANTIQVVDKLKTQIDKLNGVIASQPGKGKISMVRDGSLWIRANVEDVNESIVIGILLAVIVVFFFLGSVRSTFITGLALPNSLIGAFILMAAAGFTINVMTLLALSLSVGLLIDDAIVVRENIFRHIEMGKDPIKAASEGTAEVRLAVIATTLAVISVFGPIGFLKGVIGQFFKSFGLTICFAMLISLFDALTIAPMLSAYFAGKISHIKNPENNSEAHAPAKVGFFEKLVETITGPFNRFQNKLEHQYGQFIGFALRRPGLVLFSSFVIFIICVSTVVFVPKTFLPQQDAGEFSVSIELPPGTSLNETTEVGKKISTIIRANPEVVVCLMTSGNRDGDANVADFYVHLVPGKKRKLNTSQFKAKIREQLKPFAFASPKVKDFDFVGGGRPFQLNINGPDQATLETFATKVFDYIQKNQKGLLDPELSFKLGKPEFQIVTDFKKAQQLGISTAQMGGELRAQVEGITAAKYRTNGIEYDIRARLKDDQRDLEKSFNKTFVPNVNYKLIPVSEFAKPNSQLGATKLTRQDRARYVQVSADIAPGAGLGDIMNDLTKAFQSKDSPISLPENVTFAFIGQAENFKEMSEGIVMAMGFGTLFIFLVLASLYESFVTPLTIMLALPLAVCGSFVALAITGESLNIFSQIGIVMLLGIAAKNSILLVDLANQLVTEGMDRSEAILKAGKTRLRPILMTTMALIAGTIPIAVGLNEASKQRVSMGIAIMGGLISSTLLTLIVIPAAYTFIDRFRVWSKIKMKALVGN